MNYKSFNLEDWIGHISGVIEDESELDGNEMRDLVEFLTGLPRWIPVSERLPEERDWYLAVFKEKDTGYQLIPRVSEHIGGNKWRIIDDDGYVNNYRDILKCVAWMPLPQPYKAESEVKDAT